MDNEPPIALLPRHAVCTGCGYSLAGLRQESNCPECNAPCAGALFENSIYLAQPKYIARVSRGVRLAILSILLQVLSNVGFFVLSWIAPAALVSSEIPIQIVWYAGSILTTAISTIGWLMATAKDPSVGRRHPTRRLARLLRITVLTIAVLQVLSMTVRQSIDYYYGGFLSYTISVVPTVCYVLFATRFIQHFTKRFPGPKLKMASRRAFWAMVVLSAVFASALALWFVELNAGTWDLYMFLYYTYLGSIISMYTLLLWILWRFASVLKSVHATALTLPPAEPSA